MFEIDGDTSAATKTRLAAIASYLADRETGLSFAELRTLSGLSTEDLRYVIDTGLRLGFLRRIGAGNSLRYLRNA